MPSRPDDRKAPPHDSAAPPRIQDDDSIAETEVFIGAVRDRLKKPSPSPR